MSRLRLALARTLVRRLFPGGGWLVPVMAQALPGTALVLALSLLAAAAGLATPMITKALIDYGIMGRDMAALLFWAGVSFAVGLGTVGMGVVSSMTHLRVSMGMLGDLRRLVLGKALNRAPEAVPLSVGESATRVDGDSAELQRFLFDSVLVAVTAVFRLVGGTALMVSLDWRLALLPALAAPFELWFLHWARAGTRSRAEEVRSRRGALSGHLAETFMQMPGLRALDALPWRQAGFAGLQEDLFTGQARQRLWTEGVGAVSQVLTAVMRSAVLLVGGWLVIRGDWPIGSLVAFLAYATMMAGPLRNLLGLYHAQAKAQVALERLSALVDQARDPAEGAACPPRPARIAFHAACAEAARHPPVEAVLRAGQRVLVDGPSGIGKTRLLAACLGEAPLASGRVDIDGTPAGRFSLASRRAAITHLSQRPCLLNGTLRENLEVGGASQPDAVLWQALDTVDLTDWARARDGLETALTEAGANLSGGMRQRIALARALLRPSGVFVFDESFSEIDAPTCMRILAAIEARYGDRLRIFMAHSGPVREGRFDRVITLAAEETGAGTERLLVHDPRPTIGAGGQPRRQRVQC